MTRVTELQSALGMASPLARPAAPASAPASSPVATAAAAAPATATGSPTSFSALLGANGVGAPGAYPGASVADRIVAAAQGEVGQAEQPPGSNDSPRIATYRMATAGAPGPGPWCAYFASWAARQAGAPLGEQGQGFASVDQLYAWAQRSGRAIPAGSGIAPRPGDLIVWDEHVGVVESVQPDGRIQTIEGNSSDQVSRRTYGPDGGGAIGFVRVG